MINNKPLYNPGDKVIIISTNEEVIISKIYNNSRGNTPEYIVKDLVGNILGAIVTESNLKKC